jgi:hypothetical protein
MAFDNTYSDIAIPLIYNIFWQQHPGIQRVRAQMGGALWDETVQAYRNDMSIRRVFWSDVQRLQDGYIPGPEQERLLDLRDYDGNGDSLVEPHVFSRWYERARMLHQQHHQSSTTSSGRVESSMSFNFMDGRMREKGRKQRNQRNNKISQKNKSVQIMSCQAKSMPATS